MRIALTLIAGLALGFGAGWLAFEQPFSSISAQTVERAVTQAHPSEKFKCEPAVARDDLFKCTGTKDETYTFDVEVDGDQVRGMKYTGPVATLPGNGGFKLGGG